MTLNTRCKFLAAVSTGLLMLFQTPLAFADPVCPVGTTEKAALKLGCQLMPRCPPNTNDKGAKLAQCDNKRK